MKGFWQQFSWWSHGYIYFFFFFGETEICSGCTLNTSTKKHIPWKISPKDLHRGAQSWLLLQFLAEQSTFAACDWCLCHLLLVSLFQTWDYNKWPRMCKAPSQLLSHLCQMIKIFRAMAGMAISTPFAVPWSQNSWPSISELLFPCTLFPSLLFLLEKCHFCVCGKVEAVSDSYR